MPFVGENGQDGDKSEVCLSPAGRPSEKKKWESASPHSLPQLKWVFRRVDVCSDVFSYVSTQKQQFLHLKHVEKIPGSQSIYIYIYPNANMTSLKWKVFPGIPTTIKTY